MIGDDRGGKAPAHGPAPLRRYASSIGPVQHPHLTPAEFEAILADHGGSFDGELIRGEPVVIPPDHLPASTAQGELYMRLRLWQQATGDTGLVAQSVFVRVGGASTLGPDLAWWSAGRRPPVAPGTVTVVPDWVAEVLSPTTRENDLGPKRQEYLAAGVRELWLVDPEARAITVTDDAGSHERSAGEAAASRVLDGFSVAVADVFAA